MRSQRNLGGIFVPTDVLEFLNDSACGTDIEELKNKVVRKWKMARKIYCRKI